jgi:predicted transposase/invertase (TIGR01784 family)
MTDYAFKLVFGVRKNIANTEAFLKTVLDLPEDEYKGLTIKNPFLNRFRRKGKQGVLDLKLSTKTWNLINVEVQIAAMLAMIKRIVFYLSRIVSGQLSVGEDYSKLKRSISVVICGHIMLPYFPGYLNRFMLRDEKGGLFTDLLEVCIVELPKLPKEDDGTAVWPFLQCFKCESVKEAEMLAKSYPQLREIVGELRQINLVDEVKAFFEERIKARRDKRAIEGYIREQAFADGKAEGEAAREQLRQEVERLSQEVERLKANHQ